MHDSNQQKNPSQSCWQLLAQPQNIDLAFIRCWPPTGLPIFIVIGHDSLVRPVTVDLVMNAELVEQEEKVKDK